MGVNFAEKLKSKYYSLLNEEEEELLKLNISDNETPLWAHWFKYINTYKNLWRSNVTIKRVYDCLRFFIKNTELKTIESWSGETYKLQTRLSEISDERRWQNSTFNTYIKNMKSYFNFLEKMQLVKKSVVCDLYRKGEKPKSQDITNEKELRIVLNYLNTKRYNSYIERHRNLIFFMICWLTWARPVQMFNLNLDSFSDDRTKVLIWWAKQKWKPISYDLPLHITDMIKLYISEVVRLERSLELNERFFLSVSQKWKPWTSDWLNKLYQRIKKDIWIHFNIYMIRRHVITKLLYEWRNEPNKVQMFMWHSRLSTTLRYYQPTSKMTSEWVNLLSEWMMLNLI